MKALKPLSELVSLDGKRALITGSAVGIGKAMAYRFAEVGASLELVDIDKKGLGVVRKELSQFNHEINIHKVDIMPVSELNAGDIFNHKKMLFTKDAILSVLSSE